MPKADRPAAEPLKDFEALTKKLLSVLNKEPDEKEAKRARRERRDIKASDHLS